MADPYGTGDGGLLGGFQGFSPLTNFGLGLLSQSGPSLTPQSPWQAFGRAAQYTTEAQQQAMQNALYRQKLGESAREAAGQKALMEAIDAGKITLPEGVTPETAKTLFAADPGTAAKVMLGSLFPQAMSASDRVGLLTAQAQIANVLQTMQKTEQERKAATGETLGGATTAFADIKGIGEASRRLEHAGSVFAPGGIIEKAGGLPYAPAALQALKAAGQDTSEAELNVADALTIQKATASLTTQLQGQMPALRSNANLQNIQTAVAANTPWPAKRRQIVTSLDGLFADLKAQGLDTQLPQFADMVKFRDQLKEDDAAFTKRGEAARETPAAPAVAGATVPGVPGVTTEPSLLERGFNAVTQSFEPAPPSAAAGPAARSVKTQSMRTENVPGMGQVTAPSFPRSADGNRAVKKGEYFYAPDENGAMTLWQK
jgi:hypothetical protein